MSMTNEQREAIDRLEKRIKDNEDYKTTQVWLTDDVVATQVVLSLIKEQQEEIEGLKNINKNQSKDIKKAVDYTFELNKERDKKDKQIDLMAEFIFQNIDIEEDICNSAYVECKQETAQDITCVKCIKQYFERKVEDVKEIKTKTM